eukprot:2078035-Amphidinium_carterae.1
MDGSLEGALRNPKRNDQMGNPCIRFVDNSIHCVTLGFCLFVPLAILAQELLVLRVSTSAVRPRGRRENFLVLAHGMAEAREYSAPIWTKGGHAF